MPKAAVIADSFSAELFKLTDFHVETVEENSDVSKAFSETIRNNYDIIFITEILAKEIIPQIKETQKTNKAIISIIPGPGTSERLGEKLLKKLKKSVVGI